MGELLLLVIVGGALWWFIAKFKSTQTKISVDANGHEIFSENGIVVNTVTKEMKVKGKSYSADQIKSIGIDYVGPKDIPILAIGTTDFKNPRLLVRVASELHAKRLRDSLANIYNFS